MVVVVVVVVVVCSGPFLSSGVPKIKSFLRIFTSADSFTTIIL